MFRSMLLQHAAAELGPERVADLAAQGGRLVREPGPGGRSRAIRPGSRRSVSWRPISSLRDSVKCSTARTGPHWSAGWGSFPDGFVQARLDLLIVQGFSLFLSGKWDRSARVLSRAARCWSTRHTMVTAAAEPRSAARKPGSVVRLRGVSRQRRGPCGAYSRETWALRPRRGRSSAEGACSSRRCHAGQRPVRRWPCGF